MIKNSPIIFTLLCTTLAWSSPSHTMEKVNKGYPHDPLPTQRPFADNVDDLLGILDDFAEEDRRTERQINEIYDKQDEQNALNEAIARSLLDQQPSLAKTPYYSPAIEEQKPEQPSAKTAETPENEDRILQQVLAESEITAKEEESRREAARRQQAQGNQNEEEEWVFLPEREEARPQQAQANQNVVTPPQPAPGEEEEWVFLSGVSDGVLVRAGEIFNELSQEKERGEYPSRKEMMASMQTKMGILPEKAEAILDELGLYQKPQEAIEDDDPEIIQAIAISLITNKQEESQREKIRKAERKEETRSLAETIRDLHPKVIALREEAKEIESQASEALKRYISLTSSDPEKGNAKNEWLALSDKKYSAYSNLDQATTEENAILDQYFALVPDQDSLKSKDKAPRETPEKETKRLLENSLRTLRLQVAALRKEVRETNAEASVARTKYRELMNSDSKEEESAKKTSDDLQALKITLESELDIAIAKESIMISDYFKLGEKPTADLSKNKAA